MKHLLIDCGHGGIAPDGQYTTVGKKQYHFTDKGITAKEGVINRHLGYALEREYALYYTSLFVNHEWKDTPLSQRVELANAYHAVHGNCVYLSIHNNASSASIKGTGGTARGLEIWTSPGVTKSDEIATKIYNGLVNIVPKIRTDKYSDGDPDKESPFYVLKNTKMPAVLIEFGFFDNWEDYKLISSPEFQDMVTLSIAETLKSL
jgi:N-acetylmuramoyl-L-alanine amidase